MAKKITDISYIGEKTARKLQKKLPSGARKTSRVGEEPTTSEVAKASSIAQFVLSSRQQQKLSEESGARFSPSKEARRKQAKKDRSNEDRSKSDTIRRGDYRVERDTYRGANETFEELPDDQQSEDKSSRDPVTTNLSVWEKNIDTLDYPGIDTPQSRKVRQNTVDNLFTPPSSKSKREAWRESKPEPTDAQRKLGEKPEGADAKRTGVLRNDSNGQFIERPVKPGPDGELQTANGREVSSVVQDPTIGRDPDDGEFVDRPLENEPSITVPGAFTTSGGGQTTSRDPFELNMGGIGDGDGLLTSGGATESGGLSLDSSDRETIHTVERSSVASGQQPSVLEDLRFADEPTDEQRTVFGEVAGSLLSGREAIEDESRTDTEFFDSGTLDDVSDLKDRLGKS